MSRYAIVESHLQMLRFTDSLWPTVTLKLPSSSKSYPLTIRAAAVVHSMMGRRVVANQYIALSDQMDCNILWANCPDVSYLNSDVQWIVNYRRKSFFSLSLKCLGSTHVKGDDMFRNAYFCYYVYVVGSYLFLFFCPLFSFLYWQNKHKYWPV